MCKPCETVLSAVQFGIERCTFFHRTLYILSENALLHFHRECYTFRQNMKILNKKDRRRKKEEKAKKERRTHTQLTFTSNIIQPYQSVYPTHLQAIYINNTRAAHTVTPSEETKIERPEAAMVER